MGLAPLQDFAQRVLACGLGVDGDRFGASFANRARMGLKPWTIPPLVFVLCSQVYGSYFLPLPSDCTGASAIAPSSSGGRGRRGEAEPVRTGTNQGRVTAPCPKNRGCQTAYKPGSVPAGTKGRGGWPFIWDARCRTPRATDPDGGAEARPAIAHALACRPYLVLLPVGFTVPSPLPAPRCALTAPFHPCRQARGPRPAVCSLWHFPWGRPRRALPGTVLPWSPDFPPPTGGDAQGQRPAEGGHPAVWHQIKGSRRRGKCNPLLGLTR